MMHSRTGTIRPNFTLVCLLVFLAGGLLRWQSGWLTFGSGAAARPPAAGQAAPLPAATAPTADPGTAGVQSTAGSVVASPANDLVDLSKTLYDFYMGLDRGYFRDVHAITLAPAWVDVDRSSVRFTGLMGLDDFVRLMDDHLGLNGAGFAVFSLTFNSAGPLGEADQNPQRYPELLTLRHLPAGVQAEAVYIVDVAGSTLDRCGRWEWRRNVLMARLNPGGWRVLLTGGSPLSDGGTPMPGAGSYTEMWLHGQNPLQSKQINDDN
jgi:hypothetical protein